MHNFTYIDIVAIAWFSGIWLAYIWLADHSPWAKDGISDYVAHYRLNWMRQMYKRELRMIDTAIIAGLQHGTAFFASSCIFAIGGSFALLGATDEVLEVVRTLPVEVQADRGLFEIKILGLVSIYAYAFFKFGWAYRLFNYCSILLGAVPMPPKEHEEPTEAYLNDAPIIAEQAGQLAITGGRHFNAGLRAIFLSIAYLGWFVGSIPFIVASLLIFLVLLRRHFFSQARTILRPPHYEGSKSVEKNQS